MSDGTDPDDDRHHYNGTYDSSPLDLNNDGSNDIEYSATKQNITTVFNTLQNILSPDDFLFIYTTDHGGQVSGNQVELILWDETIQDYEFATEVDKVNAGEIITVMEQCYSGGFIDDLSAQDRVIATACKFDEPSYAMYPSYLYNEFVYHWTAAVAGSTPDGTPVNADLDFDGFVSIEEAFVYAEANDNAQETPQYDSQPISLGATFSLHGTIMSDSYIQNITITGEETYEATNQIFAGREVSTKVRYGDVIITSTANVAFIAGDKISLEKGFYAETGSSFHAYLSPGKGVMDYSSSLSNREKEKIKLQFSANGEGAIIQKPPPE